MIATNVGFRSISFRRVNYLYKSCLFFIEMFFNVLHDNNPQFRFESGLCVCCVLVHKSTPVIILLLDNILRNNKNLMHDYIDKKKEVYFYLKITNILCKLK